MWAKLVKFIVFSGENFRKRKTSVSSSGNTTTSKYTGLSCPHTSLIKTTSARPFLQAQGSPSYTSLSSPGGCSRKGAGSPLGRDQHHLLLLTGLAARVLQKQTQRDLQGTSTLQRSQGHNPRSAGKAARGGMSDTR